MISNMSSVINLIPQSFSPLECTTSYSMNSVALIWVNFSYIYEMNAHYAGILYRHVKIPRSPVSDKASQSYLLTSLPHLLREAMKMYHLYLLLLSWSILTS